ncbi:MAG: hypothetical protein AB7O38_20125 [Pirellulaceae bacterium]
MKRRIEAAAEVETREAAEWYERKRPGLGLEFLVAFDAAIQEICLPRRVRLLAAACWSSHDRRELFALWPSNHTSIWFSQRLP